MGAIRKRWQETRGGATLEPLDIARTTVDLIAGKMGADILLLDLAGKTIVADYFVIATGSSDRQIRAIVEDVVVQLKREHGVINLSVEGAAESGWVLIDYGSVVVHIFSPKQRDYYQLERLWSEAHTVVRIA